MMARGAGDPWARTERPAARMIGVCATLNDLASISPRLAARLAHAGALTAVERLADAAVALERVRGGDAAGRDATESMTNPVSDTDRVCVPTFGCFVPRVSRLGKMPLRVCFKGCMLVQ